MHGQVFVMINTDATRLGEMLLGLKYYRFIMNILTARTEYKHRLKEYIDEISLEAFFETFLSIAITYSNVLCTFKTEVLLKAK